MRRLRVGDVKELFDLGAGLGKLAIQVFLQFRNIVRVVGVELSPTRYALAERALLRLAQYGPAVTMTGEHEAKSKFKSKYVILRHDRGHVVLGEVGASDMASGVIRTLELRSGDVFDVVHDIQSAGIVCWDMRMHKVRSCARVLSRFFVHVAESGQACVRLV